MIVLDAGVVVDLLLGAVDPGELPLEEYVAPHLLDSEVLYVLRRLALDGDLSVTAADRAVAGLSEIPIARFPARELGRRIWELRHNLTAYDATYVALAEALEATLVTTDARLAAATGPTCRTVVLG